MHGVQWYLNNNTVATATIQPFLEFLSPVCEAWWSMVLNNNKLATATM